MAEIEKEVLTVTIPMEEYKNLLLENACLRDDKSFNQFELNRKLDELLSLARQISDDLRDGGTGHV